MQWNAKTKFKQIEAKWKWKCFNRKLRLNCVLAPIEILLSHKNFSPRDLALAPCKNCGDFEVEHQVRNSTIIVQISLLQRDINTFEFH